MWNARVANRIIATRIKDEIPAFLLSYPFLPPRGGMEEGVIAVPLGFISKLERDESKVRKIQYLIMIKSVLYLPIGGALPICQSYFVPNLII